VIYISSDTLPRKVSNLADNVKINFKWRTINLAGVLAKTFFKKKAMIF
jgi:hypothetical protein